jgi:hypothetical protein
MSLLEKNAKDRAEVSDTGQKSDSYLVFKRKHQEKLFPPN